LSCLGSELEITCEWLVDAHNPWVLQRLATLRHTLQTLHLKDVSNLTGLELLTELRSLTLATDKPIVPERVLLPSRLTHLAFTGNPSDFLKCADPTGLAQILSVEFWYTDPKREEESWWPCIERLTHLQKLTLIQYVHDTQTVSAEQMARLPRSLIAFRYEGPSILDLSCLSTWPCLELLELKGGPASSWFCRTPLRWGASSSLRSLTFNQFWPEAPVLFPNLVSFFYTFSCQAHDPNEVASKWPSHSKSKLSYQHALSFTSFDHSSSHFCCFENV
jgi:hypothetical protein